MRLKIYRPGNRKQITRKSSITLERIISILTVVISAITIVFSVIQYTFTESMIDTRKYNHDYYEERYTVLKSLSHSLSEIPVVLVNEENLRSEKVKETMLKGFSNFNYALLVLDEKDPSDSLIIKHVRGYQSLLFNLWTNNNNPLVPIKPLQSDSLRKARRLGKEIIQLCGQTLKHEKDSINSFTFKLWPFSTTDK